MTYLRGNVLAPAIILFGLLLTGPSFPQVIVNETQKLLASDGVAGDFFGHAVAVNGDTALIGARLDDDNGEDSGSVYVFTRGWNGVWTAQQKFAASDTAANDEFGFSIAMDGNTAVIGVPRSGRSSGMAYVFIRNAGVWTEQQKLVPSNSADFDQFGQGVSVEADTAMIGSVAGANGATYVFTRSGGVWTEQQILTPSDGGGSFRFGGASLHGDTVIISSGLSDDDGLNSGAAYVFTRSAGVWTEQQKITATDAAAGDNFGGASLHGDTVIIGAAGGDDNGQDSGSAYVFTRSAGVWTEQQKLLASDGAAGDRFGGVSLHGDTVIIGAAGDDDQGNASGSAYRFTRGPRGWTEQNKLLPSDGAAEDRFGGKSLHGDTVIFGVRWDDDLGLQSGSAYIYEDRSPLLRLFCLPTCEPFGWFGCDYIMFRCYVLPVIIIIIPIIIIGSFGYYRRRKRL